MYYTEMLIKYLKNSAKFNGGTFTNLFSIVLEYKFDVYIIYIN